MTQEEKFTQLAGQLGRYNRRRQLVESVIWLPRGLLAGLLLALLLTLLAHIRPLMTAGEAAYLALLLGLAGALLAAAKTLLPRRALLQKARFADRQFNLQERASAAVEIQQGRLHPPPIFAQQQLDDTLRAIHRVDVRRTYPVRWIKREWLLMGLTLLLLIAALLWPNPQEAILQQQRAVAQTIDEESERLQALIEEIAQNPELTDEQREELLQPIQSALEQLQQSGLSQEEAVAALSEAEIRLRELSAAPDRQEQQRALADAGRQLGDNQASREVGRQLQQGNLNEAGQALVKMADALSDLSAEEQAALAEDLADAAASLQESSPELAQQLDDAANALREGDLDAAQEALREGGATLEQQGREQAAAQQAAEAAEQLRQRRQAVAEAGGDPAGGDDNGQPGNGQAIGADEGEGETGDGPAVGQDGATGQEGQAAAPGPGLGSGPNVFAPEFPDLSAFDGIEVELPAECRLDPELCGPLIDLLPAELREERSVVPYRQVYREYRRAAYEALDTDFIPAGMQELVRDYFSSLEPGE